MPADEPSQASGPGGIHIGDVGGSVSFRALGDIVGGDKIVNITTTIQVSVEAVTQRPLVTTSPYRGLERFEDRDRDLFFGRDQLINRLLAQISTSDVLLVLGASGSGKSSVVRAGLLPAVSRLLGTRFRSFTFVPDLNPFESLRSCLQRDFGQAATRELSDAHAESPSKLLRALKPKGEEWLIFVDQFEEIFTRSDERFRRSFIDALMAIAQDSEGLTKLVLAMRADFLDRFSPFPQFAKLVEKNIDLVTDMHADELRLAIEQPAARHGVVFEGGLVEEIIRDVQGQAGSLPLLQYTLNLLWEEEVRPDGLADRRLNTRAYRELGGVRGALQKRADEIYASFGDPVDAKNPSAKQKVVRQIFLRLVDLAGVASNDAGWRPVRRRAPITSFAQPDEQDLLQALVNKKLLVSNRSGGESTVEVAHEALFTSWARFKGWIDGARQVIFVRNRLSDDAARWELRKREDLGGADDELLSGSRLGQALEMQTRGDFVTVLGGLSESETLFLDSSAALRDRRRREEEERQIRELAQARALAAEQQQRADDQAKAVSRQRRLTAGMFIVSLLALITAFFFLVERGTARRNETKAIDNAQRAGVLATNLQIALKDAEAALKAAEEARNRTQEQLADAQAASDYAIALAQLSEAARTNANPAGQGVVQDQQPKDRRSSVEQGPKPRSSITFAELALWDVTRRSPPPVLSWRAHAAAISTVLFSPDGALVLSASWDKTLKLWDAVTGREIRTFSGHSGGVHCAAISHDGRLVLSGGEDKSVRLWEAATGRQLRQLGVHDDRVVSVGFARDDRLALSASVDGVVRLWDPADGAERGSLKSVQGVLNSASLSPDGTSILIACPNGVLELHPLSSAGSAEGKVGQGSLDPRLFGHEDSRRPEAYTCVAFSADGRNALSGSSAGVSLWDLKELRKVRSYAGHQQIVNDVAFSAEGTRILTASSDKTVRLCDLATGERQLTLTDQAEVNSVAFSPNGHLAVSGGGDQTLKVWSLDTPREMRLLPYKQFCTGRTALSPDGRVAAVDAAGKLELLDVETGLSLGEVARNTHSTRVPGATRVRAGIPMFSLAFSPDGRFLLSGDAGDGVDLYELATRREIHGFDAHSEPVQYVCFSPDGRFGLSASRDKTIKLWDLVNFREIRSLSGHELDVYVARFSPDGRQVLSGSLDETLRLWNVETGECIRTLQGHAGGVQCIAYSADGRLVATGGRDKQVKLWEVDTWRELKTLTGHQDWIWGVGFSRDARLVFSAGADQRMKVWDVETGREVKTFGGQPTPIVSLSFSESGARALTGGMRGPAIVWDFSRTDRYRDFQAAVDAARAMLQRKPDDAASCATLGEWYAFRGHPDLAAGLIQKARSAGELGSSLTLARCFWMLGRKADAMREFQRALDRSEAPETYLNLCLQAVGRDGPGAKP